MKKNPSKETEQDNVSKDTKKSISTTKKNSKKTTKKNSEVKRKETYSRSKLTLKEQKLADLVLKGIAYHIAYEQAGYSCSTKGWTRDNKAAATHKVINKPHVKEYIAAQTERTAAKANWTRERALDALIKVVDKTESLEYGGGNQIVNAVNVANKMCGFDKPEDIKNDITKVEFRLPAHVVGKDFVDINRDIDDGIAKEVMAEGGRGSLKSSFFGGLKFIELIERNPNMCGIAMRSVGNTIKDSVFAQLKWAINYLGLQEDYKWIQSPFEITKKSTGQIIYFRGLDDTDKIKSIKPPLGMYIGVHLYEEFDQVKGGMQAVRRVDQSLLRGGDVFYRFKLYNTPPSATHFVNIEKNVEKEGRVLHKSNYLNAPKQWLGTEFISEAEHLKQVNPTAYANEYMGEVTGTGGMVFTNLEIRPITQEEIMTFSEPLQGLDFGWYPDPLHWTQCFFKPAQRILYITDEFRANKMSNRELFDSLIQSKRLNTDILITADSAEPKSIQDLHDYGAFIKGAEKGPGSVIYSMKWLANLTKIVIDPKCIKTVEEFSAYELDKDKDGNYTSVFPDSNNHSIDAVRYATNRIWRVRGQ